MGLTVSVNTAGLDALIAGLEPGALALRQRIAEQIRAEWAGDVRVDTGRYRDSITVADGPGDGQTTIGTDVPYAPYNEYGTARLPARPSATRAAEGQRQDLLDGMRGLLGG